MTFGRETQIIPSGVSLIMLLFFFYLGFYNERSNYDHCCSNNLARSNSADVQSVTYVPRVDTIHFYTMVC